MFEFICSLVSQAVISLSVEVKNIDIGTQVMLLLFSVSDGLLCFLCWVFWCAYARVDRQIEWKLKAQTHFHRALSL